MPTLNHLGSEVQSMYLNGVSNEEILAHLENKGYTQEQSQQILTQVQVAAAESQLPEEASANYGKVFLGLAMMLIGIIFSFVVQTGFIFYGLILVGLITLIKGAAGNE
jgi:hypothetical protein